MIHKSFHQPRHDIYSINTVDDNHKDYHVYFVYLFPYFVDDDDNMMSLFLYGLCI